MFPPKRNGQYFTERQCDILARLSMGESLKATAASLGIQSKTVHNQLELARKRHKVFTTGEILERYQRWAGLEINPQGLRLSGGSN